MAQESMTLYVIRGNSDQTEGRGAHVDRVIYHDAERASRAVMSPTMIREWGVMGVGGLTLVQRIYNFKSDGTVKVDEYTLWDYRKDLTGKWGYGWTDNRDAPLDNPEFQEYLRLKKRFEGRV